MAGKVLQRSVANQFDPDTLRRGQGFFKSNKVVIGSCTKRPDAGHVAGLVFAEASRPVTVTWKNGGWLTDCQCEAFEFGGLCAHVAALLLKAADEDMLPGFLATTDDGQGEDMPAAGASAASASKVRRAGPPEWEAQVRRLITSTHYYDYDAKEDTAAKRNPATRPNAQIVYVMTPAYYSHELPVLHTMVRLRKSDGTWEAPKNLAITPAQIFELAEEDRELISTLAGLGGSWIDYTRKAPNEFRLRAAAIPHIVPKLCRTNRLFWRDNHNPTSSKLQRVIWVDEPFDTRARVTTAEDGLLRFQLMLGQGEDFYDYQTSDARCHGGVVIMGGFLGVLRDPSHTSMLTAYGDLGGPLKLEARDIWRFLQEFSRKAAIPDLELPADLGISQVRTEPTIKVDLRKDRYSAAAQQRLVAAVTFAYDGAVFSPGQAANFSLLPDQKKVVHRHLTAEDEAMEFMLNNGFKWANSYDTGEKVMVVAAGKSLSAILAMVGKGWQVDAEAVGRYRAAGQFKIEVSSGIDWFDLTGGAKFDDIEVPLPKLLAAIRKGERMVRLDDGSVGIIPEKWFTQMALLASTANVEDENARFAQNQAAILDLLLQQLPEAKWDDAFDRVRKQLERFDGIRPAEPPKGFAGELRGYQREGLGWFSFLDGFGWGGCLADDMGLGKTVQVLALLLDRKQRKSQPDGTDLPRPSLVVAPRSLIFNWMEETRRFAPDLNVLDYTGMARVGEQKRIAEYDLVLTTYGTLRSDITVLSDVDFDYAILDESQAIKNAGTATAKAVRLIQANRRLALSGTPIENHLRELWSLFEYLNPGMLGASGAFKAIAENRESAQSAAQVLGKALRPFILRRTKSEVAKELPERTELTIHCELKPDQQKEYNQLKEHYRQSLLGMVEDDGMGKSQMQVLEALLRLRQAACHPGLIDPMRGEESSAKLEAIVEQVKEVTEEGHKALVFSQFTSFLSIVRKRLDAMGLTYEYLDGQTSDRQQRVMRFQNDPECKLFLISLKAGGVGLNLTAAEYVFLLDPWWNPAVESQAIDRAHRIGQKQQVFAYRLITKGTVEEKVLELQAKKRELADAIISASSGPLAALTKEDLQMLLG